MGTNDLGDSVAGFTGALARLEEAVAPFSEVRNALFADTAAWTNLLVFKLAPETTVEPCLVVVIAGGTNTGKSTLFNWLTGGARSPVRNTAAATRRPVLAANPMRAGQCLAGSLLTAFDTRPLDDEADALSHDTPENALFVAVVPDLPDHYVLLDTPDVDSIDQTNWDVADHLRAASDALVAVLTGEKYMDDRVVSFFSDAGASGRPVIPVMNKADAADVARAQLEDFCDRARLVKPVCFAAARSNRAQLQYDLPITRIDGTVDLRDHLNTIDAASVKTEVQQRSLTFVMNGSRTFLRRLDDRGRDWRHTIDGFSTDAHRVAQRYEPAPGAEVGGLFHRFVQQKRTGLDKAIGQASEQFVRGVSTVGRVVGRAFYRRSQFEQPRPVETDSALREAHAKEIGRLARDLNTRFYEAAASMPQPDGGLVRAGLERIDTDAAVDAIVRDTLKAERISDEFREHAQRMLEAWWNDHKGRRRVIEALDKMLVLAPTAIAGVVAVQTAGVGAAEAVFVATPIVEQFAARVIEFQFGDALFDFISPWRKEQQDALAHALDTHLAKPALEDIHALHDAVAGEIRTELEQWHEACRTASSTS